MATKKKTGAACAADYAATDQLEVQYHRNQLAIELSKIFLQGCLLAKTRGESGVLPEDFSTAASVADIQSARLDIVSAAFDFADAVFLACDRQLPEVSDLKIRQ